MNVTFDPAKDAANLAKHGVSLLDAVGFEWETAVVWPDTRRDYGEPRMVALGYIGLRIMSVVFVDRPPEQPTERRIISLRKANTREVKRYAET
ncbi:MAG: BrnT family toxin [Betaproteobacteria bacterium]|nr:BrnT family toxin [Betaproteobacteria bacterium]